MSVSPRARILVVEDELLIRLVVSDYLRDAGYDVVEAFNGDEALALLQLRLRFDLVITDVRMPGTLDGMALLGVIRETRPTLPVIVTSGHLDPAAALAGGAARFVPKPYLLPTIGDAVRGELEKTI